MQREAFWVKDGVAVDLEGSRHIQFIIRHPGFFGMTREEIGRVYDRHGEPVGIEGRARDELVRRATSDGWIRVRHYTGQSDSWSVQFGSWETGAAEVERFLRWALAAGVLGGHDEVRLDAADTRGEDRRLVITYADGGIGAWLSRRAPAGEPVGEGSFTRIGYGERERLQAAFGPS